MSALEAGTRSLSRVLVILTAALVLPTAEASAAQQEKKSPLQLRMAVTGGRARSQSPVPLDLTLSWHGRGLLEGRLYLDVYDARDIVGGRLLFQYESPEIVLDVADRKSRLLIPPVDVTNDLGLLAIRARFEAEDQTFDLKQHELSLSVGWQRRFVVALMTPTAENNMLREKYAYVDQLDLDQFRPGSERAGELSTVDVRVTARDAPILATQYCAYDVVALTQNALVELSARQLDALAQWVDAGGSVLIDASGVVDDQQSQFLNRLASRPVAADDAFIADAAKRLRGGSTDQDLHTFHYGLGRVVIATQPLDRCVNASTRTSLNAFLWKMNQGARDSVAERGTWVKPESPSPVVDPRVGRRWQVRFTGPPYAPGQIKGIDDLSSLLIPEDVQTVPFSAVATVLGLFLLAIAPGDFFLLGMLRKRTLTWVLFPVTCLCFTAFMVHLANRYMGQKDYRTSLTFVDWADDDRIARAVTLESVFTANERVASSELHGELFAPVENSHWSAYVDSDEVYLEDSSTQSGHTRPMLSGQLPARYRANMRMRKWSPQLIRRTKLAPQVDQFPTIDWTGIDYRTLLVDPGAVGDRLTAQFPDCVTVVARPTHRSDVQLQTQELQRAHGETAVSARLGELAVLAGDASVTSSASIHRIVSRVSPNGHGSLEDLILCNRSDKDCAVLIVLIPDGAGAIAYRRLFRDESDSESLPAERPDDD